MTGRLLVAYSNAATHVAATMEYLSSIKRHSTYDVSYLNVTHNAEIDIELGQFDAVFNSYCARLCYPGYASQSYIDALKAFRGVRVLAVQDEYNRTNALRDAIREIGFHVVLTCVPPQGRQYVYPSEMFPETEFITVLTGYVPAGLKARGRGRIPLAQRPIAIGYRGRESAGYYGRLGFDKYEIGRRMREICMARGVRHDIETSEEKRIYGDAWYDFLGRCRATLGSESGSNVFDFDGSLEATHKQLELQKGSAVGYEEFRHYTDPREHEIQMGQISPRIFEAAAAGTPMVLFSGQYSGIISAGEHYIELAKDFSNVDAVLDQVEDIDALQDLADRAYGDLVGSGKYDYRGFVETIDRVIERRRAQLAGIGPLGTPPPAPAPSDPAVNPDLTVSRNEEPTPSPRHVIFHRYKQLHDEHEELKSEFARETGRLTGEIEFLQAEFARETGRLARELGMLQSEFTKQTAEFAKQTADFARERGFLQSEFAAETGRLAREISFLQAEFIKETGRLIKDIDTLRSARPRLGEWLRAGLRVQWTKPGLRRWRGARPH